MIIPARSSVTGTGPPRRRSPGFAARCQMCGRALRGLQPAEIHDALHAGARGGIAKAHGGLAVDARKVGARGHRVDEVVRDVDARERAVEARRVERVGGHDFHAGPAARFERRAAARRGAHHHPPCGEVGDEIGADVAARAQHEYAQRWRVIGHGHGAAIAEVGVPCQAPREHAACGRRRVSATSLLDNANPPASTPCRRTSRPLARCTMRANGTPRVRASLRANGPDRQLECAGLPVGDHEAGLAHRRGIERRRADRDASTKRGDERGRPECAAR